LLERIQILVDLSDNENPYEPIKNFEGGKNILNDSSYPMPT